jgi:Zn ribbon nucleic-acid-binding protein
MVGLLVYFLSGKLTLEKLSLFINGRAKCPDCSTVYIRPIFGVNGVTKRYERCPVCKKWHWIGIWSERKDIA